MYLFVKSSCAMHLTSSRQDLPALLRGLELPATNECHWALYPCRNKFNQHLVVHVCIPFNLLQLLHGHKHPCRDCDPRMIDSSEVVLWSYSRFLSRGA